MGLEEEEAEGRLNVQREWAGGAAGLAVRSRRRVAVLRRPVPSVLSPKCSVEWHPTRGRGVFAARDIAAGEALWYEPPIAWLESGDDQRGRVKEWMQTASREAKQGVEDLARTGELTEEIVFDLFNSHCFQFHGKRALFAASCLMNHSCAPNIVYQTYADACCVRAAIDLKAGDEILFTYARRMHGWGTNWRRKQLHSEKGFLCSCSLCSAKDLSRALPCRVEGCSGFRCPLPPAAGSEGEDEEWVCDKCGEKAGLDETIRNEEGMSGAVAMRLYLSAQPSIESIAVCYGGALKSVGGRHWSVAMLATAVLPLIPPSENALLLLLLQFIFAWRELAGQQVWHGWHLRALHTAVRRAAEGLKGAPKREAEALTLVYRSFFALAFGDKCPDSKWLLGLKPKAHQIGDCATLAVQCWEGLSRLCPSAVDGGAAWDHALSSGDPDALTALTAMTVFGAKAQQSHADPQPQ
eukprot:Hpha_TRINITY_DN23725_c0_g1::TRINITY_DN23725_c0_g1_i1::g.93272::m.93272